jgi:hypothetical protein
MSGILELLNGPMGQVLIEGAGNQLGIGKDKAGTAIQAALPLIMGAMKNNAESPDAASGLLSALMDGRHDGSLLDKLGEVLGGSGIDHEVLQDGEGILGHVFSGRQENVARAVSKSSGIDLGSAMNLLKVAAPVVMAYLGKQTREKQVNSPDALSGLLGGMLGEGHGEHQSLINRLLDADGDGSIIDDVAGMLLSGNQKKGGLGGLLGSIFGK